MFLFLKIFKTEILDLFFVLLFYFSEFLFLNFIFL